MSNAFFGFVKVSLVLLQKMRVRYRSIVSCNLPTSFPNPIQSNYFYYAQLSPQVAFEDRILILKQKGNRFFKNICITVIEKGLLAYADWANTSKALDLLSTM